MNYVDNREIRGKNMPGFEIVTLSQANSPAIVATITTSTRALTFTGLLTTDIPISLIKPTEQAGIAIAGFRISGADTLQAIFVNPTAGGIVPTASEVYVLHVWRAKGAQVGVGLN